MLVKEIADTPSVWLQSGIETLIMSYTDNNVKGKFLLVEKTKLCSKVPNSNAEQEGIYI